MKYNGYMGKMLYVNLTSGKIRQEELDLPLAIKYIGDFGISARLAFDLIKPGIDPLSPENVVLIGAGPLAGTGVIGGARCHAFTKWPITRALAPAGGSLGFGPRLKYAGYDHLIISGRADKPVYLLISDDGVKICDAGDLWGRDIYQATDELWARHGTDNSVVCIGQAGENLVKISMTLIDKSASMGRGGLGAVMGSKNLKAIVAGGKKGVTVADRVRFNRVADEMMTEVMNWPIREEFVNIIHEEHDFDGLLRMAATTDYHRRLPDADVLNKRFGGNLTIKERLGPKAYLEMSKRARQACPSCPVGCRHIGKEVEWEGKKSLTYRSGVTLSTGHHLQFENIAELDKYMDTLSRYGLDRYAASSVEFIIYLRELGVVSKADTKDIPEYGDTEGFREIARKIAFRQGIGDDLAEGREGLIRRFGRDIVEKYGNFIKGGDAFQDARASALGVQQLDQVVNPQGAPGKGGMLNPAKFDPKATPASFREYGKWEGMTDEELDRVLDTPLKVNVGRLLKHTQDFYTIYCCLGMCMRFHQAQFYGMARLAELYSAATGIEIDGTLLKKAGERAWNMVKAFNTREGFSRKDDKFPKVWLEPLKDGDKEIRLMDYYHTKLLTPEDLERYLDEYYDERGWEIERGIPTRAKLIDLGLADVIPELDRCGITLK